MADFLNNVRVGVKFEATKDVSRKLQEVLDYAGKNTNIKLSGLDLNNFKSSINEMSNLLKNVENQCKNFGIFKVDTNGIKGAINETKNLNNELSKVNGRNINTDNFNLGSLQARYNEIKNTVDKLATVKINADGLGNINSAVISYTDSLGKSVSETMKWRDNINMATGEVSKSFEVVGTSVKDNVQTQEKAIEKLNGTILSLQSGLNKSKGNNLIDESVFTNLQNKINSINTNTPKGEIKELQNSIKNLSSSDTNIVKLQNSIDKLALSKEKLSGKYGSLVGGSDTLKELKDYENQISNLQNLLNRVKLGDAIDGKKISSEINQATNSFGKLENATKTSSEALRLSTKDAVSFGDAIKNSLGNVGIYMSTVTVLREVGQAIRNAVGYVIELDNAMIDLKKVTDETNSTYEKFKVTMHEKALDLGTQSDKLIQAVTEWSRTGESFKDAQKLAENTLILSNVGDVDVQKSQEFLVAPLKAFNMAAEESISLIDKFNNISNNSANKVNDLGEGLNRAASSMSVAGNSLEQSMALIAAAQEKTQSGGDVVGTASD